MSVNNTQVKHIAELANIPVGEEESIKIAEAFTKTLDVVDQLKKTKANKVSITHQVTGFKNILREDIVRPEFSFTQAEALANAQVTYKGFFVVPHVLQNKDT